MQGGRSSTAPRLVQLIAKTGPLGLSLVCGGRRGGRGSEKEKGLAATNRLTLVLLGRGERI